MEKVYYESLDEAIERNKPKISESKKKLQDAGVKYVLSSWIDMHGIPKTKPVPMSDFEALCMGKGPQFAVHSISFVPELTPADPDQIMLPDLDALYICPWDKTTAIIFFGSRKAIACVKLPYPAPISITVLLLLTFPISIIFFMILLSIKKF